MLLAHAQGWRTAHVWCGPAGALIKMSDLLFLTTKRKLGNRVNTWHTSLLEVASSMRQTCEEKTGCDFASAAVTSLPSPPLPPHPRAVDGQTRRGLDGPQANPRHQHARARRAREGLHRKCAHRARLRPRRRRRCSAATLLSVSPCRSTG